MPRPFEETRAHWLLRLLGNLAIYAVLAGGMMLVFYVLREGAKAGGLL